MSVDYRRGAERRTDFARDRRRSAGACWRAGGFPGAWRCGSAPAAPRRCPPFEGRPFELPAPAFELFVAGDLAELELAPLNPDLGQYFGTDDGVLVISAPRNSRLGVRGGDVVLAVDGRKPDGPLHLLRILRSYDGGERFKLDIMRSRKRESLTASLAAPTEER